MEDSKDEIKADVSGMASTTDRVPSSSDASGSGSGSGSLLSSFGPMPPSLRVRTSAPNASSQSSGQQSLHAG
eukprot:scaffold238654_cov45-Prasinocladus_malaysianus.AAC.1